MRVMRIRVLALCSLLLATPAVAQEDFEARGSNLIGLSRIFGELHHIRRMCDPDREGDVWRNRMKRLIDLEQPSFDLRELMVGAFNDGYTAAQDRFSYCDNDSEDYAAARASVGEALVSSLTAPLYSAERGYDDPSVVVVRGDEPE
jgi:uncharacterized protein (TIGR02301 family)